MEGLKSHLHKVLSYSLWHLISIFIKIDWCSTARQQNAAVENKSQWSEYLSFLPSSLDYMTKWKGQSALEFNYWIVVCQRIFCIGENYLVNNCSNNANKHIIGAHTTFFIIIIEASTDYCTITSRSLASLFCFWKKPDARDVSR
jgi:hypothetical protein